MKTDFNNQQDSKVEVKFKKVFHDCKLPSLATSGAAAYDLYSCTQKIIKPGERVKFSLGFKMLLPHNYCAKIYSRSGLAAKHGIHVSGGTVIIDSDFLGPMAVWLINLDNNNSYKVKFPWLVSTNDIWTSYLSGMEWRNRCWFWCTNWMKPHWIWQHQ